MKRERICNHHMKKASAKARSFYGMEDLLCFGYSKAEAQRMVDEGRHWIARNKETRRLFGDIRR